MESEQLRLHLRTRLTGPDVPARPRSEREEFDRHAALRAFERAVRNSPADPDYHFVLGEALLQDGQYGDALEAFVEATRLHPEEATYRLAMGEALLRLGRWDEAARAAREACDLNPDDADAWTALGAALAEVPLESASRAALARALELDGRRADAHNNLGVVLWRSGATDEAVAELRAAARGDPSASWVQLNLARMLLASGSAREAESALVRAQQLAPGDPEPVLDLADLHYAAGRRPEAARGFDKALALAPSCLEERPESRVAYRTLLKEAVRRELAPGRRGAWTGLRHALQHAAGWTVQRVASARSAAVLASSLAALAVIGHVSWQLGRPYVRHYLFTDDVVAVARAPVADDDVVRQRLRLAVRRNGLTGRVRAEDCAIVTREHTRSIECRYRVAVELLPGRPRSLAFALRVEEPYLAPEETLFF